MKKTKWKSDLSSAVTAAHAKLAEYYSETDRHRRTVHNLAFVLDPMQKLKLYKSSAFEPQYASIYGSEVRQFYEENYFYLEAEPVPQLQQCEKSTMDFISLAVAQHTASKAQ